MDGGPGRGARASGAERRGEGAERREGNTRTSGTTGPRDALLESRRREPFEGRDVREGREGGGCDLVGEGHVDDPVAALLGDVSRRLRLFILME